MPNYAYACTECKHHFEIVQSFTDDSLTTCPECSGRLRKLFNAVGVVFKGSGFYRTDSRSGPVPASSNGTGTSSSTNGSGGSKEPSVGSTSSTGSASGPSSTIGTGSPASSSAAKAGSSVAAGGSSSS